MSLRSAVTALLLLCAAGVANAQAGAAGAAAPDTAGAVAEAETGAGSPRSPPEPQPPTTSKAVKRANFLIVGTFRMGPNLVTTSSSNPDRLVLAVRG